MTISRIALATAIALAVVSAVGTLAVTNPSADRAAAVLAAPAAQGIPLGVTFTDVATQSGIVFTHQGDVAPFSMASGGVAWGDYNGDGNLDLYVTTMGAANRLYRNNGDGTFTDVARFMGVDDGASISAGAAWGDYDNDGDLDLFLGNDKADGNRLFRNDGQGFTEVAQQAGVLERSQTTSASWGDFDRDGNLDLYVTNYAVCFGPECAVEGARDHLYHNNGDGTFADWSNSLGYTLTMGGGFQSVWTDYNNDGWLDIYVVNDTRDFEYDFGRYNILYRNEGQADAEGGWSFTDVSKESGAGVAMNSMGLGVGDLDNDAFMDFYISNGVNAVLLHNQRDGTFVDIGPRTGTDYRENFSWAAAFFDADNNGYEDLFLAAGDPMPDNPNALFLNMGHLQFLNVGRQAGIADPEDQRSAAYADYDNDGDIDLYVQGWSRRGRLYRNDTPVEARGNWTRVKLIGRGSNLFGIGARVRIRAEGQDWQTREIRAGSGLGGTDDVRAHFGVGTATIIRDLEVVWPDGTKQLLCALPANREVTVRKPGKHEEPPQWVYLPYAITEHAR